MTVAIIAGRMLVAVILTAAAAAKLADLHGFRATLTGLGVPRSPLMVPLLVGLELGVGVTGLTSAWPRVTDAAAAALTLTFVGVTGFAMRRDPDLRCRCFGALSDTRLGAGALLRTLGLAAVALAVLIAGTRLDIHAEWSPLTLVIMFSSLPIFGLAANQAAMAVQDTRGGEGP